MTRETLIKSLSDLISVSRVLRFLNNWHLSQLPNKVNSEELGVRSEGTAHKIRKRRSVLYKIMDKLFSMMRGIGALYEWCVPSSTSNYN